MIQIIPNTYTELTVGKIIHNRTEPRRTDLATLPEEALIEQVRAYNNTPRQYLGYQTPAEVLAQEVLRLNCECTFPRKWE